MFFPLFSIPLPSNCCPHYFREATLTEVNSDFISDQSKWQWGSSTSYYFPLRVINPKVILSSLLSSVPFCCCSCRFFCLSWLPLCFFLSGWCLLSWKALLRCYHLSKGSFHSLGLCSVPLSVVPLPPEHMSVTEPTTLYYVFISHRVWEPQKPVS